MHRIQQMSLVDFNTAQTDSLWLVRTVGFAELCELH